MSPEEKRKGVMHFGGWEKKKKGNNRKKNGNLVWDRSSCFYKKYS